MFRTIVFFCVFALAGCATDRTFDSGVEDAAIDLSLKRELISDDRYDTGDVDITVFEGRVLLTGTVPSLEARRDLSEKAALVSGVTDVLNELVVGPKTSFGQGARDALLDERLAAALLADGKVFKANYRIAVSDGAVYLLGVAQGPKELARVTDHAQRISGNGRVVTHVLFVGDPRRRGTF